MRTLILLLLLPAVVAAQTALFRSNDPVPDVIRLVSDSTIAADVRALEAFGSRYALLTNRHRVADWIRDRFRAAGVADVRIDSFQYSGGWQKNVVATLPGTVRPEKEIVLGAHFDSQSWNMHAAPGADDNASGTAGIIEAARVLVGSGYMPRATIRFIAFAAEELGLIGSTDYADKAWAERREILLMQNYDMIGYRNQAQPDRNVSINRYGTAPDEAVLDSMLMRRYTSLTPTLTTTNITRSDSWPFALRFFKAVFVIEDENDFNPWYHSPSDSSTKLDFTYAAEIVQSAVALTMVVDGRVTDVPAHEEDLPSAFALDQNYPNPFNGRTSLRYTLPARSQVRITVVNVLGETVDVLEAGERAEGSHVVHWDPAQPSGMYVIRIQAHPFPPSAAPWRASVRALLLK